MDEQQELAREQEWLGIADLTDLYYGSYDLQNGSTQEWWDSIKEIPMATFLEFEKFTDEELANELKRRGKLVAVLKPASKIDFDPRPLIEVCESYMDEAWYKDYVNEDLPHYVFETAMECVFGKGIFERINQHRRSR